MNTGEEGREKKAGKGKKPNIFSLVKPYKGIIILLIFFTLIGNGVNLVIPKDHFPRDRFLCRRAFHPEESHC